MRDLDPRDCDPDEPTLCCVECGETLDYPEDEDTNYPNHCEPCAEIMERIDQRVRDRVAYWDHVEAGIDRMGAWRKKVIG